MHHRTVGTGGRDRTARTEPGLGPEWGEKGKGEGEGTTAPNRTEPAFLGTEQNRTAAVSIARDWDRTEPNRGLPEKGKRCPSQTGRTDQEDLAAH